MFSCLPATAGRTEREQMSYFNLGHFLWNIYHLVDIHVSVEKGWFSKNLFYFVFASQNAAWPQWLECHGRPEARPRTLTRTWHRHAVLPSVVGLGQGAAKKLFLSKSQVLQ